MRRSSKILALAVALAGAPAAAHEKGGRAIGVVESVTSERIAVKAADGHSVVFTLTRETQFSRGETPARADDVRVGERVVVHGKRTGERLEAVRVKLGASGANVPRAPSR